MSDDFFADIAKWWREAREAAANRPSFGPRVGRGLFSNWFMSERIRELEELEQLLAATRDTYDASIFADEEARSAAIYDTLRETFLLCDVSVSSALVHALYDPISDLLDEEFFGFPEVELDSVEQLDLRSRAALRNDLLRRVRLYENAEDRLDLGKRVIGAIAAGTLQHVSEEGLDDPDEHPDCLSINSAIVSLIHDAPQAVEAVFGTLFRDEVMHAELFASLRTRLNENLYLASGLAPFAEHTKALTIPTRAKDQTPAALVDTYLTGTPFADLFEATLPIIVPDSVRAEHALIVGGSGHGKSQLLLKLIHYDLVHEGERPPGVVVIDSQGDLIHTLSRLALFDPAITNSLADRLILIDPNDVEHPVALNLFAFDQARLEGYSRADRERVLNSVIDLYEYFFAALLGAELTQKQGVVFRYLARLMLAIPDATVQTLRALMEDGKPFRLYMKQLDGSAKRFFETEFFSTGFAATKKQILRRLWGVLANPVFERMFSHPENRIDLFDAMNEGKIVLINTAKDLLKAEGCSIFGRFFIAKIAQAALERATIPEDERRSTYVYIDEAHDYFDDTLEQLFNQARKYRVGLHVACQHLEQMPSRLRATVMASTSMKFAGGVSAKDARALAEDMGTTADFIGSMRKRKARSEFAAFIRNRTAGALRVNVELGLVNAMPMLDDADFQALIDQNRTRYCTTIDEVEQLIREGIEDPAQTDTTPEAPPTPPPAPAQAKTELEPIATPSRSTGSTPDTAVSTADRQEEIDAYVAGVGGQRHKQLQELVRSIAQERGFKATIEQRVLDGKGSVDVALENERGTIAIEISISTDADHELANIEKCFEAGFDEAFLIVPEEARRARFKNAFLQSVSTSRAEHLKIIGPEHLPDLLDARQAAPEGRERTVRGWTVKTRYSSTPKPDADAAQSAIIRAIVDSANGG